MNWRFNLGSALECPMPMQEIKLMCARWRIQYKCCMHFVSSSLILHSSAHKAKQMQRKKIHDNRTQYANSADCKSHAKTEPHYAY